jgi:putative transcriptional regulator
MSGLGKRLIQSAKEARKIARGEAIPHRYKIHIPPKINVRAVRRRLNLTQEEFAIHYRLTLARIRDWEQGRSTPLRARILPSSNANPRQLSGRWQRSDRKYQITKKTRDIRKR